MQNSNRARFERYRLMIISSWPESALKNAILVSAQAALRRETGIPPSPMEDDPVPPGTAA